MRKKEIWYMERLLYVTIILFSIFLCGCATTIVVTPEVEHLDNIADFKIKGKIIYNGNREYLPRTITDDSASDSILTFQYVYNVTYGKDNIPQAIPLFNPLTIVGFPIGENTLVVTGKLDILKGREVLKSYTATCGFEKARNIFSEGDTFSELRKRGLITVRDNIEAQMYQDRDFLSKLKTTE